MKKQVNLLEFEYLPEQDKCVIRAFHRPNFEYGHIGSLSCCPYVETTPCARVPLNTLNMALEFAQECRLSMLKKVDEKGNDAKTST